MVFFLSGNYLAFQGCFGERSHAAAFDTVNDIVTPRLLGCRVRIMVDKPP
jgi:hypothetical protein